MSEGASSLQMTTAWKVLQHWRSLCSGEEHDLRHIFHREGLDDVLTRTMGHEEKLGAGVAIGVSLEKAGTEKVGAARWERSRLPNRFKGH